MAWAMTGIWQMPVMLIPLSPAVAKIWVNVSCRMGVLFRHLTQPEALKYTYEEMLLLLNL